MFKRISLFIFCLVFCFVAIGYCGYGFISTTPGAVTLDTVGRSVNAIVRCEYSTEKGIIAYLTVDKLECQKRGYNKDIKVMFTFPVSREDFEKVRYNLVGVADITGGLKPLGRDAMGVIQKISKIVYESETCFIANCEIGFVNVSNKLI